LQSAGYCGGNAQLGSAASAFICGKNFLLRCFLELFWWFARVTEALVRVCGGTPGTRAKPPGSTQIRNRSACRAIQQPDIQLRVASTAKAALDNKCFSRPSRNFVCCGRAWTRQPTPLPVGSCEQPVPVAVAAGLDRHAVVQAVQVVHLVSAGYSVLGLPFMQYHMPT
jgi:hypothetical protein